MSQSRVKPRAGAHDLPAGPSRRWSGRGGASRIDSMRPRSAVAMRVGFTAFVALFDAVAIVAAAVLATKIYHWLAYGYDAPAGRAVNLALLIAGLYIGPTLLRGAYRFHNVLIKDDYIRPLLEHWLLAFLAASVYAFVTKSGDEMSRGATALFFGGGGLTILAVRRWTAGLARKTLKSGAIFSRRAFLVGYESDLALFSERYKPWSLGMDIVGAAVLRGQETIEDDLRLAVASARIFRPDDVFILLPWRDQSAIDACVDAFMRIPASIHLGPERVLDKFADAAIDKIGPISSIRLVRRPLSPFEVLMKRAFDIVGATFALVLLSPLVLIVASAIKIDSRGPVFFRQRRYGFNQEPFHIFKFRSMNLMEDHAGVRQATRGDARVTRVGRFIRRTNIDELPQLINVLLGQMSLVGPRPHIMAHDHLFGRAIALAARRHNVRPGITGWAQVHGFRGELDSDEKLRGRIEHDLYYIDNWSPWLDVRILALTLFSSKAYRNAY
ncbi:exopolysaccharide biosynthesis polyprenyl glycosylphosphotransferase [Rhodoblastus acidophilus]|uniref:Exopolysaccharide biosynthesis polyprenyl glycosylphosphotransferase n=1 Tax=Candidatus Rhodoblastus alkanivorans TaxID=2954117 RepID=A0ABS9Z103_9HYPH|nr:exopolysaccharide biosynthesis polyprenyl glycosylphosphotransferase [Candidatus Rhodoblastus alkanivorans]MCI4678586.1 exopolysaccharide biosynthesis polyprenyl glycosylphosphotransferase [Candidatus Rhodoblastus alkanivorans]MCI4681326.1 exopolysaccharide biosynthesis polyprenyl glycosylphosphotransferase [Candidatus Rhodoblastus alkanivorans]MDI4642373.1 exopolysaccharide biosynthesis polyprenyl glycosylphosphotransferase [Rhodoblastus acidophilus]